jgi:hypothetical protein
VPGFRDIQGAAIIAASSPGHIEHGIGAGILIRDEPLSQIPLLDVAGGFWERAGRLRSRMVARKVVRASPTL